jgi:hypothetical protein
MNRTSLSLLLIAVAVGSVFGDDGLASGKVLFRVVDDTGKPVAKALVDTSSLSDARGYEGLTDTNGYFRCHMRRIYPPISGGFFKEGYYRTRGVVWRGPFGVAPTNTLTVVLKRIVEPVPMVRRDVRVVFPVLGEPVGFDFEVGDWVEPHGAGRVVDVWVTGWKQPADPGDIDFRATMVASNALDGFIAFPLVRRDHLDMVRSEFQPPQTAPSAGYTNSVAAYVRFRTRPPLEASHLEGRDHLFRFRTTTNRTGAVESAHVGWCDRSVELTGYKHLDRETGRLRIPKSSAREDDPDHLWMNMGYYWNPDPHSRSLEPKDIADRQGR